MTKQWRQLLHLPKPSITSSSSCTTGQTGTPSWREFNNPCCLIAIYHSAACWLTGSLQTIQPVNCNLSYRLGSVRLHPRGMWVFKQTLADKWQLWMNIRLSSMTTNKESSEKQLEAKRELKSIRSELDRCFIKEKNSLILFNIQKEKNLISQKQNIFHLEWWSRSVYGSVLCLYAFQYTGVEMGLWTAYNSLNIQSASEEH